MQQMSHTLIVNSVTNIEMDRFTLTTSCELGTHIGGLGAKHGISSSYNGHTVWLTLHSDLSMEVTEMNFSLKDQ